MKSTAKETIHAALITAMTIAAALIWKDVVVAAIEILIPKSEVLFYQFLGAVFATVILIFAIFFLIKAEEEAEDVIEEVERYSERFRKKPVKTNMDSPIKKDTMPPQA